MSVTQPTHPEGLRELIKNWRSLVPNIPAKYPEDAASDAVFTRCADELEAALASSAAETECESHRTECEQCDASMVGRNAVCLDCWNKVASRTAGEKPGRVPDDVPNATDLAHGSGSHTSQKFSAASTDKASPPTPPTLSEPDALANPESGNWLKETP